MIFPGPEKFSDLARQVNLIPVWKPVPADLLTPVSAYLKLTSGRAGARHNKEGRNQKGFSFLFESVEGGETIARYTYLGADPFLIVRFQMPEKPPNQMPKPRSTRPTATAPDLPHRAARLGRTLSGIGCGSVRSRKNPLPAA